MSVTLRDPKDALRDALEEAFDAIPIPRTNSGQGWFFANDLLSKQIEGFVNYLLSPNGIMVVDTILNLPTLFFQALKKYSRSDSRCAEELRRVVIGDGESIVQTIIENAIKSLTYTSRRGAAGRYIRGKETRNSFVSRIVDEISSKPGRSIFSFKDFILLIQHTRQYPSFQDGAAYLLQECTRRIKARGFG